MHQKNNESKCISNHFAQLFPVFTGFRFTFNRFHRFHLLFKVFHEYAVSIFGSGAYTAPFVALTLWCQINVPPLIRNPIFVRPPAPY